MPDRDADPSAILFYTVLTPERSADRRKERVAIVVLATPLGFAAFAFVAAGAWPVSGFCGLVVALFYGALCLHDRMTQVAEILSLTRQTLCVRRTQPDGHGQEWTFQPYWLRVELADSGAGSNLILRSHGRAVAIGAFLSEDERRALAHRLIRALAPLSGIAAIAAQAGLQAGSPLA